MADIVLDEQTTPSAPSSGQLVIYPDSASSTLLNRDDSSRVNGLGRNWSTADQVLGTSDTYLTGSRILIPSVGLQVGTRIRFRWSVSKSAAGTAAPVYTVRLGTAGTTSDTSVWTHTGVAQTGVAETGWFELHLTVRGPLGGSAVNHGVLVVTRTGGTAATGLAAVPAAVVTGATYNSAWASGQGIGLSINPGASSAWTVGQVQADLDI
jgi:hypothetical protein